MSEYTWAATSSMIGNFTTDKKVTTDALWFAIGVLEAYEINVDEAGAPYEDMDRETIDELLAVVAFLKAEVSKRNRAKMERALTAEIKQNGYDVKNPIVRNAIKQTIREQRDERNA